MEIHRGAPSHRRLQPPAPASSSRRRPSRPPEVQRPARKATAGHLYLGVARASGQDGAERPASTSAVGAIPTPTSPDPVTPGPDPRRVEALAAVGGLGWWWLALVSYLPPRAPLARTPRRPRATRTAPPPLRGQGRNSSPFFLLRRRPSSPGRSRPDPAPAGPDPVLPGPFLGPPLEVL
ncbi:hypothetical protein PVAP13_7KG357701 [Panicum virgatum]|uniref:Uncharacterized protein n=1 Tax=Panicum virgatum TaxID=38727 RepID=A0A8T0QSC3_PANVG|nr:hypothetical protein PVAP13_7KG357701 [Panicum virgatum]